MRRRGDADGDCIQMQGARPACLQARFRGAKHGEAVLLAEHFGCHRIRVHNRSQLHSEAGLLKLAVDAEMIAAESPGAKDGYIESILAVATFCHRLFCLLFALDYTET